MADRALTTVIGPSMASAIRALGMLGVVVNIATVEVEVASGSNLVAQAEPTVSTTPSSRQIAAVRTWRNKGRERATPPGYQWAIGDWFRFAARGVWSADEGVKRCL
jgi:hypothetical protein